MPLRQGDCDLGDSVGVDSARLELLEDLEGLLLVLDGLIVLLLLEVDSGEFVVDLGYGLALAAVLSLAQLPDGAHDIEGLVIVFLLCVNMRNDSVNVAIRYVFISQHLLVHL